MQQNNNNKPGSSHEWMIRDADTSSLGVQAALFGRCWNVFLAFAICHVKMIVEKIQQIFLANAD